MFLWLCFCGAVVVFLRLRCLCGGVAVAFLCFCVTMLCFCVFAVGFLCWCVCDFVVV